MITDTIENLSIYTAVYPEIASLFNVLEINDLGAVCKKTVSDNITLIPINSKGISSSFDNKMLESHKKFMDIHITLAGNDIIAYADMNAEVEENKAYSETDDYALHTSNQIKKIEVPAGYFCIIPNNFAHMALYEGHSNVKKIVVKLLAE